MQIDQISMQYNLKIIYFSENLMKFFIDVLYKVGWLVGFHGISTIVGMPNPVYIYIYIYIYIKHDL